MEGGTISRHFQLYTMYTRIYIHMGGVSEVHGPRDGFSLASGGWRKGITIRCENINLTALDLLELITQRDIDGTYIHKYHRGRACAGSSKREGKVCMWERRGMGEKGRVGNEMRR